MPRVFHLLGGCPGALARSTGVPGASGSRSTFTPRRPGSGRFYRPICRGRLGGSRCLLRLPRLGEPGRPQSSSQVYAPTGHGDHERRHDHPKRPHAGGKRYTRPTLLRSETVKIVLASSLEHRLERRGRSALRDCTDTSAARFQIVHLARTVAAFFEVSLDARRVNAG